MPKKVKRIFRHKKQQWKLITKLCYSDTKVNDMPNKIDKPKVNIITPALNLVI